jgi:serine/threonine protein kinase
MSPEVTGFDCLYAGQVSREGQDLMHRLLQPDPQKRLTMGQVMDHPWFQRSLPPPLMTLNARCAPLQTQSPAAGHGHSAPFNRVYHMF